MNIESIEEIVAILKDNSVSEICVEESGFRLHLKDSSNKERKLPQVTTVVGHAPSEPASVPVPASPIEETILVTAPMVGTFHHNAQPVRYGSVLKSGTVVGAVESIKVMNDVSAGVSGRVVEVLVEDGAPVEYGQPLFRLSIS